MTKDFDAGKEVAAVRDALRYNFGAGGKMIYKPEIFSRLGIYSKNEFKIEPYLFEDKNPKGRRYYSMKERSYD